MSSYVEIWVAMGKFFRTAMMAIAHLRKAPTSLKSSLSRLNPFFTLPILLLIETSIDSRHYRLGQIFQRVTPLQTKDNATGDLQAISRESTVI